VLMSARAQKVSLSADTLPSFVEQLGRSLAPEAHEAALLGMLRGDVTRAQITQLLRSGQGSKAVDHLDALRSSGDADAAFLRVAVMLSEGRMAPADAEAHLAQALVSDPAHEGLRVLLAEVRTALRGADAGLATLESVQSPQRGTLVGQALSSA